MKMGVVVAVMVMFALTQVSSSLPAKVSEQEVKQSPLYIEKRLVITAKEPEYFTIIPYFIPDPPNWTFGPVFNNDVLYEVIMSLWSSVY